MPFSVVRRGLSGSSPDAIRLLDGPGCPICRTADEAGSRWFETYENETRTDLAMRERLERSYGFCGAHTRQLFDLGASTSWLARWVFADVVPAGHVALGRTPLTPPEPCPACTGIGRTTQDNLRLLAGSLSAPEVTAAYESSDGVCVGHGLAVIELAPVTAARFVAASLTDGLTAAGRELLCGRDPDAVRRRSARPADEEADGCPLCAAVVRTERGYLSWLAEGPDTRGREAVLCAGHLADLPDGDGTDAVVRGLSELWRKELSRFLDRTSGASERQAARAGAAVGQTVRCHLDDLCAAAVERERLLLGLQADDLAAAERIPNLPGVCLRHGLGEGIPAIWRHRLRGRLGLLAYELTEAERKSSWDARWESKGTEMDAWRRAPALVAGWALRGGLYSG